MRTFKEGDIVRIKNALLPSERYDFVVDECMETRIGKPCWIRRCLDRELYGFPIPSDCLVLIRPTKLTPEQIKLRQLEREVEILKNRR